MVTGARLPCTQEVRVRLPQAPFLHIKTGILHALRDVGSSERKSQQLGMPYGTAFARLRKEILFDLAGRCDLLTCFACGEEICTSKELSVEHKQPWEGRDTSLFWDLDNIAFSHRVCNLPHVYPGKQSKRKQGDKWWCDGHEDYLDEHLFSMQTKGKWVSPRSKCKECRAQDRRAGISS